MKGIRIFASLIRENGTEEMVSRFVPTCDESLALSMARQYFDGYVKYHTGYISYSLVLYRKEEVFAGNY